MTLVATEQVPTLVLLEGPSDVAAVRAVAAAHEVSEPTHGYRLVDMGGATNIRRHVRAARRDGRRVRITGMCDSREVPFFDRALREHRDGAHAAGLVDHGFQVCRADLEEELIRALGPARVVRILGELGLGPRFETFQSQLAWRGRPLAEQLHRFAGIASGRKVYLAGQLAAALAPDEAPLPLRRLVADLARSAGG